VLFEKNERLAILPLGIMCLPDIVVTSGHIRMTRPHLLEHDTQDFLEILKGLVIFAHVMTDVPMLKQDMAT